MTDKDGVKQQLISAPSEIELPPRELGSERRFRLVHSQKGREGNSHMSTPRRPGRRGMLDRALQAQLGKMLQKVFSNVAEEPVPERFVRLLEALKAQEEKQSQEETS